MFGNRHYVPILKSKAAEFDALGDLAADVRSFITPLVDVIPPSWDWTNDRPERTVAEHVERVAPRIASSWPRSPIFIDLNYLDEADAAGTAAAVTQLFALLRELGVQTIPVTGLGRSEGYQTALRAVVSEDTRGACLRLDDADFDDLSALQGRIETLLGQLELVHEETHIIVDLRAVEPESENFARQAAASILRALPSPERWATLTLAASGFPENLGRFGPDTLNTVARVEWSIWSTLGEMPRKPAFGDYGIDHAVLGEEVDPRIMLMSANLRYATDTSWLVFKGRNTRHHGHEQFRALCAQMVARPECQPADYSWGDNYIRECAAGRGGTGGGRQWRRIGYSHHLTHVARQIASLPVT